MRRLAIALLAVSLCAPAQRDFSGAAKLRVSMERLQVLGRVLHIAAHPDDENTALLALSARGWKYRTAYLSLTRGEGGQNLIGSEQGELMGVIRTQELLAARRIDGAEQRFTRAIDFGFSKTAEETLAKWDREKVLGDVVWHIRKFRPDVIVLRFSGTPRDGHGQHQASAILGREAFVAAADPVRFPGLPPWKARRLVLNIASFSPAMEKEAEALPQKITLDLGQFDPLLGYSFGEIAGMSRSLHRSQAMGWREDKGAQRNFFIVVAGEPAAKDLMEGVDTTWARVPESAGVARHLREALSLFDDRAPEKSIPALIAARRELLKLSGDWAAEKRVEIDEMIAASAGLFMEANAPKFHIVAGQPIELRLNVVNRSNVPVVLKETGKTLEKGRPETLLRTVPMPSTPTQPYWLAAPRGETMYSIGDRALLDAPDGPPSLIAPLELTIAGETLAFSLPVRHRYVDRIYGELTRPLLAVPEATVRFPEKTLLFPDAKPRPLAVQVASMTAGWSGRVSLQLPKGWVAAPGSHNIVLKEPGEQWTATFLVTPPAAGQTAKAKAIVESAGKSSSLSMIAIEYPHIPPQALFAEAEANLVRSDIKILSRRIGYIMGSGDDVPRALEQLGCEVTLLGKDELAQSNLSRFDAIVTGVRAFNTRADLRANARRLFDYAAGGGTVIVQYNVMEGGFFGGDPKILANMGPYSITLSQGRVTEEDAQVEFKSTHPLLAAPNPIGKQDFDGWVQERGLYFAAQWDPKYETLFRMHDRAEKPLEGGTLFARHGKGVYIFTPLSWFRQLPAGVPGAYRIFANFLSAGKAR